MTDDKLVQEFYDEIFSNACDIARDKLIYGYSSVDKNRKRITPKSILPIYSDIKIDMVSFVKKMVSDD